MFLQLLISAKGHSTSRTYILSVLLYAGANDELEKQIAAANQKCSEFFVMMKKDKEQALLLPPYEFEVRRLSVVHSALPQSCVAAHLS